MIGRRSFITGLLASAAMPLLIDQHRVVLVGLDLGRDPQMVVMKFIGTVEHFYFKCPIRR